MKKLVLGLTLLLPVLTLAYTNPGSPQGFVNDFGAMLAPAEITALEQKLETFKQQTGHELSVVTIPSLQGDTVENFAEKLFQDWGIGQKEADNGVLLLISRDDRELRIEVGYGLEGALTDAQSYWIIQNQIVPEFKAGNYAAGINAGVDKIIAATEGEVIPSDSGSSVKFNFDWIWFGLFAFIWLVSILARSKSWWAGGVVGGILGIIFSLMWGFLYVGFAALVIFIPFGLLLDYFVSKKYAASKVLGTRPPWWAGGGGFGSGGSGGFGGFGGGSSGGGGASGSW